MGVTATFDKVADIIAETSEIDRETITPDSHTIDDLGIDSLDFLDIVFAIDKEFGIKIPLVPLHNWLPDTHTQASTPVSVLLAGVLLKLGTYGMLRFGLQLFPEAWAKLAPALAIWAAMLLAPAPPSRAVLRPTRSLAWIAVVPS